MKLLLDTHTFLWFVSADRALSQTCLDLIESPNNTVLLSIASLWEVAVKASLGRLELHGAHTVQDLVETGVYANQLELLGITPAHLDGVRTLPMHHRDPSDRLLVAQALSDGLVLLSRDRALSAYGVPVLW